MIQHGENMSQEINIEDTSLIEVLSKDCASQLAFQYTHIQKRYRQIIDDLALVYHNMLEWQTLLQATDVLPYRQTHTGKYVCGISQKGAKISILCNRPDQQRYVGQWFDYKALISKGGKRVKFVKLSAEAQFFFENMYEEAKKEVIDKHGR